MHFYSLLAGALAAVVVSATPLAGGGHSQPDLPAVFKTTCGGKKFQYDGLAGYGTVPGDFRDKYGETVSMGSSLVIEDWKSRDHGKTYKATLWGLPDRGWNTQGTTAYQPRLHEFEITFSPASQYPSGKNLQFKYKDTILFTDPSGKPVSGLDPTTTLTFKGLSAAVPAATFPGDGFGGSGPGGTRMCLDPEGLVLDKDGGFWISDEYGPFLYHFTKRGKLDDVIRPPNALIPERNGADDFASNNPPIYNSSQIPNPENPDSGRNNNQGFEGLTYDAQRKSLFVMLQSAAINDGAPDKAKNRYTRLLEYKINKKGRGQNGNRKPEGQWVVPLPQYTNPSNGKKTTAAASEILSLGNGRFLVLSRDSSAGRGADRTESVYRNADIFSIRDAADINGKFDDSTSSFAPGGVLSPKVKAAEYCPFINFNIQTELDKFSLINGGSDNDAEGLLNEKWEGLSLVPVWGKKDEYYLFALNDNDFITQNGFYNFGKNTFKDASGFSLDNQALVFKVTL
ncbi:hypothetical protein V502_07638 [Pseudogymnoascus sp. VKM F-4520 (FW-2644)]|nr:hypothetical protein V502_07638 [Pseudogymnoascus sp. VKM F-4520 (FW-2644)]